MQFKTLADLEYNNDKPIPSWMEKALAANGEDRYLCWDNWSDYMGDGDGWSSPKEIATPNELWELDDLNELVNFYFVVYRNDESCPDCDGTGYNPATHDLYKGWYRHSNPSGSSWEYMLTQDEVQALYDSGRISAEECPDAAEYNSWHVFHDSIDAHVCLKARATRLGVYGTCPSCGGDGRKVIDEDWRLGLQMWFLYPRKGASCGVFCKDICENELDGVFSYLGNARERIVNIFAALPE